MQTDSWAHRNRRYAIAIALGFTLVVLTPNSALSGNWQNFIASNEDNGNTLVFYNLGPRLTNATDTTLFGSYNTIPDLHISRHYVPATADVVYTTNDSLSNSISGRHICVTPAGGGQLGCNVNRVEYHGDLIANWTDQYLLSLACHESGHVFGLQHPPVANFDTYGCMVDGNHNYTLVRPHNVDEIKAGYPL